MWGTEELRAGERGTTISRAGPQMPRSSAHPLLRSPFGFLCLLAILEQLEIRRMSRTVSGLRIDLMHCVIHCHRRFAESRRDQLQLAFVMRDVTRCIHARQVRLEQMIDLDRVAVQLQPPRCDGPEIGLEADQ